MCAPHPAALTTTASSSAASNAAMVARASARARSGSPACAWSAPQQPWAARDPHLHALARRGTGSSPRCAGGTPHPARSREGTPPVPAAPRAPGCSSGRAPPRPAGGERRQERLRRREGRREQAQETARPDEALEPAPLVEAQRAGDERAGGAGRGRRPSNAARRTRRRTGEPGRRASSSARPASIRWP